MPSLSQAEKVRPAVISLIETNVFIPSTQPTRLARLKFTTPSNGQYADDNKGGKEARVRTAFIKITPALKTAARVRVYFNLESASGPFLRCSATAFMRAGAVNENIKKALY